MTAYHHMCIQLFVAHSPSNVNIRIFAESLSDEEKEALGHEGHRYSPHGVRELTGVIDRASQQGWEFISSERVIRTRAVTTQVWMRRPVNHPAASDHPEHRKA